MDQSLLPHHCSRMPSSYPMALKKIGKRLLAGALWLVTTVATGNQENGSWSPVVDWNILPIHAVLTPDKKVLTYGQGAVDYSIWDPALGIQPDSRQLLFNNTDTDIFCSGQLVLPENDIILIAGGDIPGEGNDGNPNTTFYDESNGLLFDANMPMAFARWYPTLTALPDGEVLIQGGIVKDPGDEAVLTPEVFNTEYGWRRLDGATSAYAYGGNKWWYPRSWVVPNGLIFGISGRSMYYLNYEGEGDLVGVDTFDTPNTYETSTAVMYRPGMILQIGGGPQGNTYNEPATSIATIIDVTGDMPIRYPASPMNFSRHWADATVLPDGRVLVTGGSHLNNTLGGEGLRLAAEIWDPDSDTWTIVDAESEGRLYHSVTLLLADGRVLSAGGGNPGPLTNSNAQVFHPPYLYDGDNLALRPVIGEVQREVNYGEVLTVPSVDASRIERVTLVKSGSVTHSWNNEQRFIELTFTKQGEQLLVDLPESAYLATPGNYLLFALDDSGVPSEAQMIHFSPVEADQLTPLPTLIDPLDALLNCEFPEPDAWGWDPVVGASCPPHLNDNIGSTEPLPPGAPIGPVPTDEPSTERCDYSDASEHNGWGWDSVAQQSCPPLDTEPGPEPPTEPESPAKELALPSPIDECDYTHASVNNGWGWNDTTQESCPPENLSVEPEPPTPPEQNEPVDNCSYKDAALWDGWGWDPVKQESCPPLQQDSIPASVTPDDDSGDCDYKDAALWDGWGWNPLTLESCPPLDESHP